MENLDIPEFGNLSEEAQRSLIGLFNVLLQIDRKQNPEQYKMKPTSCIPSYKITMETDEKEGNI